jgi:hypothetical protein
MELIEFRIDKPDKGNKHWVSRSDVKGGGFWRKNRKNTAAVVGGIASASVIGIAALKNKKNISDVFRTTKTNVLKYASYGLDHPRVEAGFKRFDKLPLPQNLKDSANNLIGKAKVFVGVMHSDSAFGKATLRSVNTKHNYSTYTLADDSILSIGSIGRNTLAFQSYPNPNVGDNSDFANLITAFSVNNSYTQVEVDPSTSRKIISATRSMFEDQVKNAPDNTIFMASPFDSNPKLQRAKRNIYAKAGFQPVSEDSNWIWAMKENGKLKKNLTDDDFAKVGFREDYKKYKNMQLIEFRAGKARSSQTKQKISKGLREWWDDQGTTKKIGLSAAALVGGGAAIYGLSKGRRGAMSIGTKKPTIQKTSGPKGSPTNPYVEQIDAAMNPNPRLNEKGGNVFHPQRRAGRTFTDDTGKVRKKGGFLPNFVTDNALVRRVRNRPIDVTKSAGASYDNITDIRNEIHRRRQSPDIPFSKMGLAPYKPLIEFKSIGITRNEIK